MWVAIKRALLWLMEAYVAGQVIEIDGEVFPVAFPEYLG